MKKYILITILSFTIVFTSKTFAQQDPMNAHYMFNQLATNPAYAGSKDFASFSLSSRHQWVGLEGAPQTQILTAHTPVKFGLGAGLSIVRDVAGPMNALKFEASFSYKLQISENNTLSFGLMTGFHNSSVFLTNLEGVNPDDMNFQNDINVYKPVFGSGLYFNSPNAFVGISVPDLVQTNFQDQSASWTHKRHYFFNAGFIANLNEDFKIRPTTMLRYTQASPISAELTTSLIMRDKIWFGLIYRYNDAVGALAAVQINPQLRMAYSYDYSITKLRTYQAGSHEISIIYDLNFDAKNHASPRYF